jgi:hypothetical protein
MIIPKALARNVETYGLLTVSPYVKIILPTNSGPRCHQILHCIINQKGKDH